MCCLRRFFIVFEFSAAWKRRFIFEEDEILHTRGNIGNIKLIKLCRRGKYFNTFVLLLNCSIINLCKIFRSVRFTLLHDLDDPVRHGNSPCALLVRRFERESRIVNTYYHKEVTEPGRCARQ